MIDFFQQDVYISFLKCAAAVSNITHLSLREDLQMISITTYWEQFRNLTDNLPLSAENEEYSKQIATARQLIEIGLRVENLGFTEIKAVVNKLQETAKHFEHEISYTADKHYVFNLPKITNTESLIFAIIYYQHLSHYANVTYQGAITFYPLKSFVLRGVNEKKITTHCQAQALLEQIIQYGQEHDLLIDPSSLLKASNEEETAYLARIFKMIQVQKEQSEEPPEPNSVPIVNPPDEIVRLEQLLAELNEKKHRLQGKSNRFSKRLSDFNLAKQQFVLLNAEWHDKWLITKVCYWFASLFFSIPLIHNLKTAQEQWTLAENELNHELVPQSAEAYSADLQKQLEEIITECEQVQKQINDELLEQEKQRLELEMETQRQLELQEAQRQTQIKMQQESLDDPEHINDSHITESMACLIPKPQVKGLHDTDQSNLDNSFSAYCNFFKEYLPGKHALSAAAIGTAAIVIQNLLYE